MTEKLNILSPTKCLISCFSEYFLKKELPKYSPSALDASRYWVIVPTQRLATSLRLSFSNYNPHFIPPKILTLSQLVKNLVEEFTLDDSGSTDPNALKHLSNSVPGSYYQSKLMEFCLTKYPKHQKFSSNYSHEILQLHTEIYAQGLNYQKFFQSLREKSPYYFSNEDSAQKYDRILQDIQTVIEKFESHLEQNNFNTSQNNEQKQIFFLLEQLRKSGTSIEDILKDVEKIFVLGISSFNANIKSLLYLLNQNSKVHHWTYPNTEHSFIQNQHRDLIQAIAKLTHREALPSTPQKKLPSTHEKDLLLTCESSWDEASKALQIAHILQNKLKIPPHSIGILVTEEFTYATAFHRLKDQSTHPWIQTANIALSRPVNTLLIGSWLDSFQKFLRSMDDLYLFFDLITHPFSQKFLPDLDLSELLQTACKDNLLSLQKIGLKHPSIAQKIDSTIQNIFGEWLKLKNTTISLKDPISLDLDTKQVDVLKKIFLELFDFWAKHFPSEASASLKSALKILWENFITEVELSLKQGLLSLESWKDLVDIVQDFCALNLQDTGEPAVSYQILKFDEARHLPLEVAILVGCREGQLPKSKPKDILVSDFQKRLGGLPGWQGLESMEYLHFSWLKERVPHRVFLLSKNQETGESMPSCFLTPGIYEDSIVPVDFEEFCRLFADKKQTLPLKTPSGLAEATFLNESFFNQNVFGVEHLVSKASRMSASTLTKLMKCPQQFLSYKLKLDSPKLPTTEERPNDRGSKFHKFFELFFKDMDALKLLAKAKEEGLALCMEEIQEKSKSILLSVFPESFLLELEGSHFLKHSWILFLEWLIDQWEVPRSPSLESWGGVHEYSFSNVEILLGEDPYSLYFHGQIDSIRSNGEVNFICDYKTNKIPEAKHLHFGIEAQLLIYYLALQKQSPLSDNLPKIAGYWSILKGEWKTYAAEEESLKLSHGLATAKTQSFTSRLQHLSSNLNARIQEMKNNPENPFFADASLCGFCELDAWCRKQDPRFKDWIGSHMTLKKRLKKSSQIDKQMD